MTLAYISPVQYYSFERLTTPPPEPPGPDKYAHRFLHRPGIRPYPVFQIPADSPAEIKSDTAGLFIISAVISGKPFFQKSRKVLRIDADARIPDDSVFGASRVIETLPERVYFKALEITCSTTKAAIFHRQYLTGKGFIFQGYSLPYKLGSILAHRLFYNSVQIIIF